MIFFQMQQERLLAFSPLATLKRGFSVTYQNGKILGSVKDVDYSKEVSIRLADGRLKAIPQKEHPKEIIV